MPSLRSRPTQEPSFTLQQPVAFDELDAFGMLHNARWPLYVERALTAWFVSNGRRFSLDRSDNPDKFHVVRHLEIDYLAPFPGIGDVAVEVWVEGIGVTHCTYGFRASSAGGATLHASGRRTIVRIDPDTGRPDAWSDGFRTEQATIARRARAGE
jgi:acyl-CoA thioester hydrolase